MKIISWNSQDIPNLKFRLNVLFEPLYFPPPAVGEDEGEGDFLSNHLKLTFVAERPPPPHIAYQEVLMAAETGAEYLA